MDVRGFWARRARCAGIALLLALATPAHAQVCLPSGTLAPALLEQRGCQLDSLGITPLSDLTCGSYKGYAGGLYPGSSTLPHAHAVAGSKASFDVVPRGADGTADRTDGLIGLASIGMSNTESEFSWFRSWIRTSPGLHPRLRVVNGAQATRTAQEWADRRSIVWTELDERLAAEGLTPAQLQVAWIKLADAFPAGFGEFPFHAEALEIHLMVTLRNAKARYPNLAIVYLSSRTRAYITEAEGLSSEPYAYESGFAVKWTIEEQLAGNPVLRFDGAAPPAPWIAWGPYLWADGDTPRSDGFTWPCDMVSSDFVHPFFTGQVEVTHRLIEFFLHEPTAARWFLAPRGCGLLGIEAVVPLLAAALVRRGRRSAPRVC